MQLASLVFFFIIIVPSAIIHEYMHGWVANYFGDSTAKYAGRLTLNPFAHIDLWGTILMPISLFLLSSGRFLFAYAKPVPVNPMFLRGKYAGVIVAAAGPLANFATAAILGMLVRMLPSSAFATVLGLIVYANVLLGVFNLVPFPPLDGAKILFPLLPLSAAPLKEAMERYGFFILLFFLFFVGFHWVFPLITAIYYFFTGAPLPL